MNKNKKMESTNSPVKDNVFNFAVSFFLAVILFVYVLPDVNNGNYTGLVLTLWSLPPYLAISAAISAVQDAVSNKGEKSLSMEYCARFLAVIIIIISLTKLLKIECAGFPLSSLIAWLGEIPLVILLIRNIINDMRKGTSVCIGNRQKPG